MKIKKAIVLILISILTLVLASVNVSALVDPTGDLFHAIGDGTYEIYNDAKDDIDITDISYTTSDTQITVILTVDGSIQDGQLFGYFVYVGLEGTASGFDFFGSFTNGIGYVFDSTLTEHLVTKDTNTLTFVFDVDNPSSVDNVWAWAYELAAVGSEESWVDWAPDIYFPAYALFYGTDGDADAGEGDGDADAGDGDGEGDGDGDGDGDVDGDGGTGDGDTTQPQTPGFEILVLFVAIALLVILTRRKK